MLVAFSISPTTSDETGSVTAAVRVVRASGLPNRTSSMITEVEGATRP